MEEWIKVEDRLPEENQDCLIKVEYMYPDRVLHHIYSGIYNNKLWVCDKTCYLIGLISVRVSHWKPRNESKTCSGCRYDGENCMCPVVCKRDKNGNYTGYDRYTKEGEINANRD